ncbi:hypothetical protein F4778DRAFT_763562 [Xylariomycetidae sp. FL2044]|nr:hypothetical protein F4778DRAFT_763562 [Xylariomycetidae sp. FL2044]
MRIVIFPRLSTSPSLFSHSPLILSPPLIPPLLLHFSHLSVIRPLPRRLTCFNCFTIPLPVYRSQHSSGRLAMYPIQQSANPLMAIVFLSIPSHFRHHPVHRGWHSTVQPHLSVRFHMLSDSPARPSIDSICPYHPSQPLRPIYCANIINKITGLIGLINKIKNILHYSRVPGVSIGVLHGGERSTGSCGFSHTEPLPNSTACPRTTQRTHSHTLAGATMRSHHPHALRRRRRPR